VVKPAPEDALLTPLESKAPRSISTTSSYKVLLSRSIFSKDQRGTPDTPERSTTQAAPPRPEAFVVFTGAMQQEGQYWAFFEDTNTHQTLIRGPGETLCGGKVVSVSLNGVDFQPASGNVRKIVLLQNMEGRGVDPGTLGGYVTSLSSSSSGSSSSYGSRDGRSYDRGSSDRGSSDRSRYDSSRSDGSRGYDGRSRSSDGRSSDRGSSDYRSRSDRGPSDGRSSDRGSSDRGSSDRSSSDRGSSDRGTSDARPPEGSPSAAPGGPSSSGGSAADILEQMRRRRAQEIGGGK